MISKFGVFYSDGRIINLDKTIKWDDVIMHVYKLTFSLSSS